MRKGYVYIIPIVLLLLFPSTAMADLGHLGEALARMFVILVFLFVIVPIFNLVTILVNIFSSRKMKFCISRGILNLMSIYVVSWYYRQEESNARSHTFYSRGSDGDYHIPICMIVYLGVLSTITIVDIVRFIINRFNIEISLNE